MNCPTNKCRACCCYNVPFIAAFLEFHQKDFQRPVLFVLKHQSGKYVIPFTNADWEENKCPFLRADFRCAIYSDRPEVCRKMAEIPEMVCPFL